MEQNLKRIKAIAYDIDGVLTNGMIIPVGPTMDDLVRIVDAKDAFASMRSGFGEFGFSRKQQSHTGCGSPFAKNTAVYRILPHMGARGELLPLGRRQQFADDRAAAFQGRKRGTACTLRIHDSP